MLDVPVLRAPTFLIATPQVLDPFFARSVVFLVHHDAEGSLGYIVNRSTELTVREVCEGLGVVWGGAADAKVHFGGPVQAGALALIYREPEAGSQAWAFHFAPDLFISGSKDDFERLSAHPPTDFRAFIGYAGWGAGQIDGELTRGDWLTADVDPGRIFAQQPDDVWAAVLRSIGVDPGAMPIHGGHDGGAVN